MSNIPNQRWSEKGNVLFLILIAVALFAALSYVVTQSTRSGGGSTEREKNILSSAQMTQYPTSLRTSLIRMVLAGVAIENVKFDAPASAGPFTTLSSSQLVFHPQGGGATFQQAPPDLSASGSSPLTWTYNAEFDVPGIGIDGPGGNDVIAFLPGVSSGVCKQVNEELGIDVSGCTAGATFPSGVPEVTNATAARVNTNMINTYAFPAVDSPNLTGPVGCTTVFDRQASGCFAEAVSGRFVFYSVLLER
jgi:hypothetical protein